MEGLEFDTPRGKVLVRKDHEGIHEAMWGLTSGQKNAEFGYALLDNFRVYPAADVIPPERHKTIEWIESWPTRNERQRPLPERERVWQSRCHFCVRLLLA